MLMDSAERWVWRKCCVHCVCGGTIRKKRLSAPRVNEAAARTKTLLINPLGGEPSDAQTHTASRALSVWWYRKKSGITIQRVFTAHCDKIYFNKDKSGPFPNTTSERDTLARYTISLSLRHSVVARTRGLRECWLISQMSFLRRAIFHNHRALRIGKEFHCKNMPALQIYFAISKGANINLFLK